MATMLRPPSAARTTLLSSVAGRARVGSTSPGTRCAMSALTRSPLLAHQAPLLALPIALLLGVALVVDLLAAGKPKLDLGDASGIEIELERHERHALALDGPEQFLDLALVQEKLARPGRGVSVTPRLRVLRDMGVDQINLAAFIRGVGLGDVGLAGPQRLHLRAGELNARLELFLDVVVEARLPVLGDELAALALRRHDLLPLGSRRERARPRRAHRRRAGARGPKAAQAEVASQRCTVRASMRHISPDRGWIPRTKPRAAASAGPEAEARGGNCRQGRRAGTRRRARARRWRSPRCSRRRHAP